HATPLVPFVGGPLMDLAVALLRKETLDDLIARTDRSPDAGRATDSPRSESGAGDDVVREHGQDLPDGLVAASQIGAGGGSPPADVAGHRVGDGEASRDRDAPRRPSQGHLFDW